MHGGVPRLRDRPALVGLTTATVLVELVAVSSGERSTLALVPQAAAPVPFGVFHDLRWLLVFHGNRIGFVVGLGAVVVVRTAMTAAAVGLAWPDPASRPPARILAGRALAGTAVVGTLVLLSALLAFVTGLVSLSWPFFVSVPVLLMVGALVPASAVLPGWWRGTPPRRAVTTVLGAFAGLSLLGGILVAAPVWLQVPTVVVAGVFDAACWLRLVHAVDGSSSRRRRVPFVAAVLGAVVALVVGGTAAGFAVAVAVESARPPVPRVRAGAAGTPVLVVKGFDSRWEDGVERRWVGGDHRIRRFSYRGVDAAGEPKTYAREDTHRSLRALVRTMRDQVSKFVAAVGEPVSIVAESEGALVARTYLAATPGAPVRALVMLSPLLEPGRVFYPRHGADGPGAVTRVLLDGLTSALAAVGPVHVPVDAGLLRSIADEGPVLRGLLDCRTPHVRELAVLPVDSGVAAPWPRRLSVASVTRPAFHGGLLGDPTTARLVEGFLGGGPPEGDGAWPGLGRLVQVGASAWQVPTLPARDVPAWRRTATGAGARCAGARAELARWVGAAGGAA